MAIDSIAVLRRACRHGTGPDGREAGTAHRKTHAILADSDRGATVRTRQDRPSVWQATATLPRRPPPEAGSHADVVVVGGGITGLTVGLLLAEEGRRVAVLEGRRLGAGATGGSTGKLTSQHGLVYRRLAERHGDDVARLYGAMNQEAIDAVRTFADRYAIDAGLVEDDAFVYTERAEQVDDLREEAATAARLGLPASFTTSTPLPFEVAGAVRFTGQARFSPVAYLHGLADAIETHDGCSVHEEAHVVAVRDRGPAVVVETGRGSITADHVILATLAPILDRGLEFARMEPSRTYGAAVRTEPGSVPDGMYLSAEEPTRSTRRFDGPSGTYLIVVGDAHRTGADPDTVRHHEALERYADERFGAVDVVHRWSAQDFVSVDALPFVGSTPLAPRISVATGFSKWGLSGGTAAARVLADTLAGRPNPAAAMLDPRRGNLRASAVGLAQHNLTAAGHFVGDRVRSATTSIDDIPPGGAAIVRRGLEYLAVSRDDTGAVTACSAVCSHLGCLVRWNTAERSWDCPCHGSRFSPDGEVLEGPASRPLRPRDDV